MKSVVFAALTIGFYFVATAEVPGNALYPALAQTDKNIHWFDLQHLPIEGQGWSDTAHPYDRLPAKADGVVRGPVWSLSHDTAGLAVRFVTDSKVIHGRWSLRSTNLSMPHMPATGDSGLDLYVRNGDTFEWAGAGRPTEIEGNMDDLVRFSTQEPREFILYLPLYNGIAEAAIGIEGDSYLAPAPPRPEAQQKPIVFYGTSITQGGCASRPGAAHTAILGRWLGHPVINLGFSGNGTMDPEFVDLLAEIDAACYVIDTVPNMTPELVSERAEDFLSRLRAAAPNTPIVAVESIYPRQRSSRSRSAEKNAGLRIAFDALEDAPGTFFYLPGDNLLGDDGEGTVDGVHPTDLGFMRMAEAFAPVLRQALGR